MAFPVVILAILVESCAGNPPAPAPAPAPVSQESPLPEHDVVAANEPSLAISELKKLPLPRYPTAARRKGIGGYVIVQFVLSDAGRPVREVVVLSEPRGVFEKSCVAYAKQLRFDVPAVWAAKNPDRRLEFACVYQVIGSPNQPELQIFPMNTIIVSIRKNK